MVRENTEVRRVKETKLVDIHSQKERRAEKRAGILRSIKWWPRRHSGNSRERKTYQEKSEECRR